MLVNGHGMSHRVSGQHGPTESGGAERGDGVPRERRAPGEVQGAPPIQAIL